MHTSSLRALLTLLLLASFLIQSAAVRAAPEPTSSDLPILLMREMFVPGIDFRPLDPATPYRAINGGIYATAYTSASFDAHLILPGNATITGVTFYFRDNSASYDFYFTLSEYEIAQELNWPVKNGTASGLTPSTAVESYILPFGGTSLAVDNAKYSYHLTAQFADINGSMILYGANVHYLVGGPLTDDYVSFVGTDFYPSASDLVGAKGSGRRLYASSIGTPYTPFIAPLDLPDGAVVTDADYYALDNDATTGHLIGFYISAKDPSIPQTMSPFAAMATTTTSDFIQTLHSNANNTLIDNTTKAYYLRVEPSAATPLLAIVGARVHYSLPASPGSNLYVKTYGAGHFRPIDSRLEYHMEPNEVGIYPTAIQSGQSYQTSLNLPQDMLISRITYYFRDNSASSLDFSLQEYTPAQGSGSMASWYDTLGLTNTTNLQSIDMPTPALASRIIDPTTRAWTLRNEFGSTGQGLVLFGVRVEYYSPRWVYLPAVTK